MLNHPIWLESPTFFQQMAGNQDLELKSSLSNLEFWEKCCILSPMDIWEI